MHQLKALLFRLSTALLCATSASAQTPTEVCINGAPGDWLGYSMANAGDVDGDGDDDIIVGSLFGQGTGTARVICGRTGATIYTFAGDALGENFGVSVSGAGDVDGDGHADLIAGAWLNDSAATDAGMARVFSGRSGNVLYTFYGDNAADRFGAAVSGAGDVDNDGFDDVMVGATGSDLGALDSGSVRVHSGRTGLVLYTLQGNSEQEFFGAALAAHGDVTGDGIGDLLVGAWREDSGAPDGGSVFVFSGSDGTLLHTLVGDRLDANLGTSVASIGDIDGDGIGDIAGGAPADSSIVDDGGMVRLWSGVDGTIIDTIDGLGRDDGLGHALTPLGDIDGDFVPDFAAGAPGALATGLLSGEVRVYSGATRTLLNTLFAPSTITNFGAAICGGDTNADGFSELSVGAYWDGQGGFFAGRVCVVDLGAVGNPPIVRTIGAACPGSGGRLPSIEVRGMPVIQQNFTARLRGTVPGVGGGLFIGDASPPLPLALIGVPGCTLDVAPFATMPSIVAPDGMRETTIRLPFEPGLIGFSADLQWLVTDLGATGALPITTSDVARFVIGGDVTLPSPRGSFLRANPSSGLMANGPSSSTLTITLLDGLGMPVPGQVVEFRSSSAAVLTQPTLPTDALGEATGTISATQAGPLVIEAFINPGPEEIRVRNRITLLFF